MKLVIVHYHLRPGGIRRIIELATPHLLREAPRPITRVVLATGELADRKWHDHFVQQLPGVLVEVLVAPSFNYLSEQRRSPRHITAQIRRGIEKLLANASAGNCLVWAHNLAVGRNLLLARELAAACAARNLPLVSHHHDWWFDNRWARWSKMRQFGFRTLATTARAAFPEQGQIIHTAINHADDAILSRHFGTKALWLPNLSEPASSPSTARVRAARRWLRNKLAHDGAPACVAVASQDNHQDHIRSGEKTFAPDPTSARRRPVWLLPCRTLRRKNVAEALLLTRWLRPEAWLVVTGTASSADEIPYFRALKDVALRHRWRLRLGVLAGDESRKPGIPDLLAASETVLLTSIQEGFGLPYLEAAAAQRPLIARRLPNIAPDLDRFGFRFPQAYDEILIAPELFNWPAERARQQKRFKAWRATMPTFARTRVSQPSILAARRPVPVPFSRLTLAAQLEVLAHPTHETWAACAPLNPFLEVWQKRASARTLRVTPWPRSAKSWLGGKAYARRFFTALATLSPSGGEGRVRGRRTIERFVRKEETTSAPRVSPLRVQADLITAKLDGQNLYPLLWNKNA